MKRNTGSILHGYNGTISIAQPYKGTSMHDKRTPSQRSFDLAAHGWAFCNDAMLKNTLIRLEEMAKSLKPGDARFELVETIRSKCAPSGAKP
jgi:hypothetical protein